MAKKSTSKVSSKKVEKKTVKKAVPKTKVPAPKKGVKKQSAPAKTTSKAAPAKPIKKEAPAKVTKKAVKQVVKKVSKPAIKNTVKASLKPAATVVKQKVVAAPKKATPPVKTKADLKTKASVNLKGKEPVAAGKPKIDAEEKFHNKAQRIMKELEETMDMDKVKPRIKVPVFSGSKPKNNVPQKLPEPTNTTKEKFQVEFEFRSSKAILFNYLSDSSGLAGWFADEVKNHDDQYTFVWEGSEMNARQIAVKDQQLVRYQWNDESDGTYFQFEIKEDDITSDIALLITDWANPGEKETNSRLWESQVQKLRQLIGSH